MGHLAGKTFRLLMDFLADLEQPERIEVAAVVDDVAVDAGEQAGAHQRLAGRNRIGNAHVLFRIEPERAGLVLVYLDGRLLLSLAEREYALGAGLQLGMSGGSVVVESIRLAR